MTASKSSGTPPFQESNDLDRVSPAEKEDQEMSAETVSGEATVRLFPRRKAGEIQSKGFRGRAPAVISLQVLEKYFGRPQMKACQELEVSLATMKRLCRKFGIKRWPGPAAPFQHHGMNNSTSSSASRSTQGSPVSAAASSGPGEEPRAKKDAHSEAAEQLKQLVAIATEGHQPPTTTPASSRQPGGAIKLENKAAFSESVPGGDQVAAVAGGADLAALAAQPLMAAQLQALQANPLSGLQNGLQQAQAKLLLEQQAQQTALYVQYLQALQAISGSQARNPLMGNAPGYGLLDLNALGGASRASSLASSLSAADTSRVSSFGDSRPTSQTPTSVAAGRPLDLSSLLSLQQLGNLDAIKGL